MQAFCIKENYFKVKNDWFENIKESFKFAWKLVRCMSNLSDRYHKKNFLFNN